jgi:hypothetical protein
VLREGTIDCGESDFAGSTALPTIVLREGTITSRESAALRPNGASIAAQNPDFRTGARPSSC